MRNVVRTRTKEEARAKAVLHLNMLLETHQHLPLLVLLSGGSSLQLLDALRAELFSSRVSVGMLDERFSSDPKVNNFAQLAETDFFSKMQERYAYFIDSRVQEGEELEGMAMRLQAALKNWKEEHPGGKVIITQGMGPDGHTSGMMPYPNDEETFRELFEDESRWVSGYDAAGKNEYALRVTATMPFLRLVDHSVACIMGKEKAAALSRVLTQEGSLAKTPARIMNEMKEVNIFTDIA